MEIPTNEDGGFEAVTADGDVVGTGKVLPDPPFVEFSYTDGQQTSSVSVDLDAFTRLWETVPPLRALTLRAAP